LAALLRVFGDFLLLSLVHLYLWWLAALGVGFAVMRRLDPSSAFLSLFATTAVVLSHPALTLGHAYNSAATALGGATLLLLLRYEDRRPLSALVWAGTLSGLTIMAKQNVGFFVVGGAGLALALDQLRRGELGRNLRPWLALGSGLVIGVGPPLAYFASKAGAHEALRQLLTDATSAKGGSLRLLGRAVPRLIISLGTPHRALYELVVSGLLLAPIVWYWRCHGRAPVAGAASLPPKPAMALWTITATIVALVMLTLIDLPSLTQRLSRVQLSCFPSYSVCFFLVLYASLFVGFVFWVSRNLVSARFKTATACVFGASMMIGNATSSLAYLPTVIPVVLPIFLCLVTNTARSSSVCRLTAVLSIVCALLEATFPAYAPHFTALMPLQSTLPFAGLWGPTAYAQYVRDVCSTFASRLTDRRVLWLSGGGPHLAFGGRPVYNVAVLYLDTYNSRIEPRLKSNWDNHPPDVVVLGPFTAAPGAQFLTHDSLTRWLGQSFEPRVTLPQWGLVLYDRRNPGTLSRSDVVRPACNPDGPEGSGFAWLR
jgi:hypothetical protein